MAREEACPLVRSRGVESETVCAAAVESANAGAHPGDRGHGVHEETEMETSSTNKTSTNTSSSPNAAPTDRALESVTAWTWERTQHVVFRLREVSTICCM